MNRFLLLLTLFVVLVLQSCGTSDRPDIKGSEEAVDMAGSMLEALGGKKAWAKLNSVYIRTLVRVPSEGDPYIIEEWTNLSEPRFMNKRTTGGTPAINIINGNDGWHIQGDKMEMIAPQTVTSYLRWFDQYFLRVVKLLAQDDERIEVRKAEGRMLEVYMDNKFLAAFDLNEENLPGRYITRGSGGRENILQLKEFSEYKGYKFPLEIQLEARFASYRTDYFDPSHLEAERAFNITFDPNEIIR
jgi:hypothetical protein